MTQHETDHSADTATREQFAPRRPADGRDERPRRESEARRTVADGALDEAAPGEEAESAYPTEAAQGARQPGPRR